MKKALVSSDKLELDYQAFIEKVEQSSIAVKEKVRIDLQSLREQAANM